MIKLALVGPSRRANIRVGEYLRHQEDFKLVKLDDAVREICRRIWGIKTTERVPQIKRLQIYDAIYKIDRDAWVQVIEKRVTINATKDVVVPDVRYLNEIKYLKDIGFKVIRVSRTLTTGQRMDYPRYESLQTLDVGSIIIPEWLPNSPEKVSADYSIIDSEKEKLKTFEQIRKILDIERQNNV